MLIDNTDKLYFGFTLQNSFLEYETRIFKADLLGLVPLQLPFMIKDLKDATLNSIGPGKLIFSKSD